MFGALSNELTSQFSEPTPLYTNGSLTNQTNSVELMANDSLTLLEIFRMEVIGIVVSSAIMIVFFLGMIGAFLESVLCLRIFGAILSYLFLLTFGGAFYIIILLVISHVPLKLILSTISCAAVGITIHALLAIAPFAFADLISRVSRKPNNFNIIDYLTFFFLVSSDCRNVRMKKVETTRTSSILPYGFYHLQAPHRIQVKKGDAVISRYADWDAFGAVAR